MPYPSEAEIAEELEKDKEAAKKAEAEQEYRSSNGFQKNWFIRIGEEVKEIQLGMWDGRVRSGLFK